MSSTEVRAFSASAIAEPAKDQPGRAARAAPRHQQHQAGGREPAEERDEPACQERQGDAEGGDRHHRHVRTRVDAEGVGGRERVARHGLQRATGHPDRHPGQQRRQQPGQPAGDQHGDRLGPRAVLVRPRHDGAQEFTDAQVRGALGEVHGGQDEQQRARAGEDAQRAQRLSGGSATPGRGSRHGRGRRVRGVGHGGTGQAPVSASTRAST
jgi:hypothetical protein